MISDRDNYIVVNYHYVEDPQPDRKGIKPCPVDEFAREMRFISDNFQTLAVPDVFQAAVGRRVGRFCAITFDDCLRGVYVNAVPILRKHDLFGTFFAITATFGGLVPSVHKVHALLSKAPAATLVDLFNDWAKGAHPTLVRKLTIPKDYRVESRRVYDDTTTANFKETLILLPRRMREEFLVCCFKHTGLDESGLNHDLFMTSREVRELYDTGMAIGSHTHTHDSLEAMGPGDLAREMQLSSAIIKDITGAWPQVFSYPHGRWVKPAARVFFKAGIGYAVTIEKRGIGSSDQPLLIPRYDTNDLRDYLDAIGYR